MASTGQDKRSTMDETTLVDQLNDMLRSINLPISLISPTDLTPTLLIAILERLLGMRISLIDRNKESKTSRHSKIQNMKIFLGVLETDILNSEVDLSEIDPRRLADGEWNEVFYIGELLCWIGRKQGLAGRHSRVAASSSSASSTSNATLNAGLSQSSGHRQTHSLPQSSKSQLDLDAESLFQGGSTVTGSTKQSQGTLSPFSKVIGDSDTSAFTNNHEEDSEDEYAYSSGVSDILGGLSPFKKPEPITVRCIHQVTSPFDNSLLFSVDPTSSLPRHDLSQGRYRTPLDPRSSRHFDHTSKRSHQTIRYDGYIEPVDEDIELESFEHSRSMNLSQASATRKEKPSIHKESVKSQYTRTLELLNERTRLLTQLAELKNSHG